MGESTLPRFTKWGFNYMETDECISDVVPVAHPCRFINFLFLNLASHLLHCVCLNELPISQLGPRATTLQDYYFNVQNGGIKTVLVLSVHFRASMRWKSRKLQMTQSEVNAKILIRNLNQMSEYNNNVLKIISSFYYHCSFIWPDIFALLDHNMHHVEFQDTRYVTVNHETNFKTINQFFSEYTVYEFITLSQQQGLSFPPPKVQ